jgi:hypothetical protein
MASSIQIVVIFIGAIKSNLPYAIVEILAQMEYYSNIQGTLAAIFASK